MYKIYLSYLVYIYHVSTHSFSQSSPTPMRLLELFLFLRMPSPTFACQDLPIRGWTALSPAKGYRVYSKVKKLEAMYLTVVKYIFFSFSISRFPTFSMPQFPCK